MRLGTHAKIGIGWTICTTFGIYLFYLSKSSVEKRRYDNMKIRERMRLSNVGDYELGPRHTPRT
nr:PREDICTED: uncharacterized protein LOC103312281 [Tribolium castaneum]|eukprot:XP_008190758.1 PREDICTED: uncharacterized protein LOC103312281 [Tribolium castaneum]